MPTKQDLMGLGMGPFLANQLGVTPVLTSALGASVGSARQIGGQDYLTVIVTGTSSLKVPPVGGDTGATLGSPFAIANITAATIAVYAASNALGSAVTFYTSAASGILVSVPFGKTALMYPVTVSTWVVVAGASAG
jgi:hypothetical protein